MISRRKLFGFLPAVLLAPIVPALAGKEDAAKTALMEIGALSPSAKEILLTHTNGRVYRRLSENTKWADGYTVCGFEEPISDWPN